MTVNQLIDRYIEALKRCRLGLIYDKTLVTALENQIPVHKKRKQAYREELFAWIDWIDSLHDANGEIYKPQRLRSAASTLLSLYNE